MPTTNSSVMQRFQDALDRLTNKVDEVLKDLPALYVPKSLYDRDMGEVKKDIRDIQEKSRADKQWENDEHAAIKQKIADEFQAVRETINRYALIALGIIVTGILVPILLHAIFKIF